MDLNFIDRIYYSLESDLECTDIDADVSVLSFSRQLSLIAFAVNKVRTHVSSFPFDNKGEEIHFFKFIKPRFTALSIFYSEKYALERKLMVSDVREVALQAYRKDLRYFSDYFAVNASLYHYYNLNHSHQDDYYFLRSFFQPAVSGAIPDGFSTNGDYTFAKFIAFERMRELVCLEIGKLEFGQDKGVVGVESEHESEPDFEEQRDILRKAGMKCLDVSLGRGVI